MAHAMILLVLGLLPGAAESLSLSATEWAPPHRAEALAAYKPLGSFVRVFDKDDAAVLSIRHAGGEPDGRFAEQLRDALVALGVPAARIRLVPASSDADHLILEFSSNGETVP
jgi:hypothetical protein